jgi:hypothetical protein
MRKSMLLVVAAIAAIGVPSIAYGGGGDRNQPGAVPVAAPLDREALVSEILSTWRGEASARGMDVGLWESDMRLALAKMNDGKLLSLKATDSYDSVVKMMGGVVGPSKAAVSGPEVLFSRSASSSREPYLLGAFSSDLVYVPITPCRAFDTRFSTGGKIAGGATRSFYTNFPSAGATAWSNQGGDASHCPAIPFDPVAVAITVTATGNTASGFLNMWPYLGVAANTSFVNWGAGGTIANTTMVLTCYSCGPDINIAVSATTDVIGDIVGYYEAGYPGGSNGYVWGAAHVTCNTTAPTVNRAFTNVGSSVTVTQAGLGSCSVDFGANIASRFYQISPGNASSGVPGEIICTVTPTASNVNAVFTDCYNLSGTSVNTNFFLIVY